MFNLKISQYILVVFLVLLFFICRRLLNQKGYTKIDLRKIQDDDVFIIGKDHEFVPFEKAKNLHERLKLAIELAKKRGEHIVFVCLDDCNLKVIKKNANPIQ